MQLDPFGKITFPKTIMIKNISKLNRCQLGCFKRDLLVSLSDQRDISFFLDVCAIYSKLFENLRDFL